MNTVQALYSACGFATAAHHSQRRKYTLEPYAAHSLAVMEIVGQYFPTDFEVLQAAVLHDVIEDTPITMNYLAGVFGSRVAKLVEEVTDISKPTDGNRAERKAIDRAHLALSSPEGASIKLADLIDNTSSIVKYDPGFAKIYLPEKAALLEVLKHGNTELWKRAAMTLQAAEIELYGVGGKRP